VINTVPTSDKYLGAFMAGALWGGKSRLIAMSHEVTSKSSE